MGVSENEVQRRKKTAPDLLGESPSEPGQCHGIEMFLVPIQWDGIGMESSLLRRRILQRCSFYRQFHVISPPKNQKKSEKTRPSDGSECVLMIISCQVDLIWSSFFSTSDFFQKLFMVVGPGIDGLVPFS